VASYHGDQADGLRRLFGRDQPRVVTFASGSTGVGKSVLVANVAALLARQGREVLILDENTRNVTASYFGALARHDLLRVVNGEKQLADVLVTVAPGVRILPAAQAVRKLGSLSARQQSALIASFTGIERSPDVILVDASLDHPLGFSPLGLAAHDAVIVISATGASITDAYALIKKVSLGYARKNFRILVTKVRSLEEAKAIYGNIAKVARSRGVARLEFAGCVPLDESLKQSSCLAQPVSGLFPEAPASRAYRSIAAGILSWPVPGQQSGGLEQFVQQLLHLSQQIDPVAIYA
jgi:flagellar biosynthesis protein FlhG